MKNYIFFFSLLFLLTACPVGLDYPPGTPGDQKINLKLIGNWKFTPREGGSASDSEVLEFEAKAKNAHSLQVTVITRGEMYALNSDELTAWETEIDGIHLLYLKPSDEEKYYLYQYQLKNNSLSIADVPLKVGGTDAVKSTQALIAEIKASINHPEFLSDVRTFIKD